MTIDIYTAYTARELRKALGLARLAIKLATQEAFPKEEQIKYKENALEETLKECEEGDVQDKIEYIYRFITHLAWLGQEVTDQDHLHFKEEEK